MSDIQKSIFVKIKLLSKFLKLKDAGNKQSYFTNYFQILILKILGKAFNKLVSLDRTSNSPPSAVNKNVIN